MWNTYGKVGEMNMRERVLTLPPLTTDIRNEKYARHP